MKDTPQALIGWYEPPRGDFLVEAFNSEVEAVAAAERRSSVHPNFSYSIFRRVISSSNEADPALHFAQPAALTIEQENSRDSMRVPGGLYDQITSSNNQALDLPTASESYHNENLGCLEQRPMLRLVHEDGRYIDYLLP